MSKLALSILYFGVLPFYKLLLLVTGDRRRSLERDERPSYWIDE